MPPPNGFGNSPPPPGAGFPGGPGGSVMNDPRVAQLVSEIGRIMGEHFHVYLERVNQTLSPSGRVVEVFRRDENNQPVKQPTTTPQLLAELNDNMQDLVDELAEMNEHAARANAVSAGREPRRRRRRRG